MQFSTEDLGQLPLIQDPATLKNIRVLVHTTITFAKPKNGHLLLGIEVGQSDLITERSGYIAIFLEVG